MISQLEALSDEEAQRLRQEYTLGDRFAFSHQQSKKASDAASRNITATDIYL
jgi:hypothetical protein